MVGQVRVAPFLPLATLTFDVLTCGETPENNENNENNEDYEDNAVIETYLHMYLPYDGVFSRMYARKVQARQMLRDRMHVLYGVH